MAAPGTEKDFFLSCLSPNSVICRKRQLVSKGCTEKPTYTCIWRKTLCLNKLGLDVTHLARGWKAEVVENQGGNGKGLGKAGSNPSVE